MGKFFVAQGIGYLGKPTAGNNPKAYQKWPFVVLMGPSGNLSQLEPPSGFSGKVPSDGEISTWHNYEGTLSHCAIAWKRNHLIGVWSKSLSDANSVRAFAWTPQRQQGTKINGDGPNFDDNTNFDHVVIEDGTYWSIWNTLFNRRDMVGLLPINDAILWFKRHDDVATHWGLYKADVANKIQSGPSHWFPRPGNYGNPGNTKDDGWSRLPGASRTDSTAQIQAGVDFRLPGLYSPSDLSHNICEIVRHGDTFYIIGQYYVVGVGLGNKGCFIHNDFGDDSFVGVGAINTYTQRNDPGAIGARMRSATIHNNNVFMLDNGGRVFEIRHGGIIQKADLTTLGTPWSSGITGGALQKTDNITDWDGADAYRPLLRSFNGQLHAFLNFRTTFRIAQGKGSLNNETTGAGICWFTSFDGSNWQDRSEMLPTSGIQTPSGNNVLLSTWLSEIIPYRHSAFMDTNYPSGYGPKAPKTNHLGQSAPMTQGSLGEPSGFKQSTFIPFWSSGTYIEPTGKPFNQLNEPLEYGPLSGYLFPTFVAYPSGYAFVSPITGDYLPQASGGVWRPIRGGSTKALQGASGYDYTGCSNYHVAGFVDNDDENNALLRLCFSRSFVGGAQGGKQVPSIFFDLTKTSGFIQRNEAWNAGQLSSYVPIDLYNPEVIISSGHILDSYIDTTNKMVKVKFKLIDWHFWEPADIHVQYSINNGVSWADATTSGATSNLSTGTSLTDPSGMGISSTQNHEIYWLYSNDLSKNEFYPDVRLRIRALIK